MLPYPASFYRTTVLIRRVANTLDVQGGDVPTPAVGVSYPANVQQEGTPRPQVVQATEADGKATTVTTTVRDWAIVVAYDPADTLIPTLAAGDQAEFDGHVATITGAPDPDADTRCIWRIRAYETV